MHSRWSISAARTRTARPAQSAGSAAPPSASAMATGSAVIWLPGTTSAISSHQKVVMAVSTRPLFVMGSAITTSNALTRSEATISRRPSPAS